MKKIGVIGGMSCESSAVYYTYANELIRARLGGLNSARFLMASVNFAEVKEMQMTGDWEVSGHFLAREAQLLEKGGADIVLLATNTMHKVADMIQEAISIPFLHIADAVALALKKQGITKVGLTGTRYTMLEDFYKQRLEEKHNIQVVIPNEDKIDAMNDIIFDELCQGKIKEDSHALYVSAMQDMKEKGAEGIILGCTEIGLLIKEEDFDLPLICSTKAHIEAAVEFSLSDDDLIEVEPVTRIAT